MSFDHKVPSLNSFFPGFSRLQLEADDVSFSGVIGGSGPPVLLLHGYPQTHIAWRYIAAGLADTFTVVVPDLPGYGLSKIEHDARRWDKRRVGDSLVTMMTRLRFEQFAVVGHDRGARVGYRLALDHPDKVLHFASLAVVPTLEVFNALDMSFALANFHWSLLAQPFDLPERLLDADPDAFIDATLTRMAGGLEHIDADALEAYRTAFRVPSVRHAICEDYRAGPNEDLAHDAADRAAGVLLQCPVLVLWPDEMDDHSGNDAGKISPLDIWHQWACDVTGRSLPGGHLLPEACPEAVLAALRPFLLRR